MEDGASGVCLGQHAASVLSAIGRAEIFAELWEFTLEKLEKYDDLKGIQEE